MGARRTICIDGKKLRREIMNRGLTSGEIAVGCGVSTTTINTYIRKNSITPAIKELLGMKYNIPYDSYRVNNSIKNEPEVVQHSSFTEEYWERLYKVIYSATYEAMKQALSGE